MMDVSAIDRRLLKCEPSRLPREAADLLIARPRLSLLVEWRAAGPALFDPGAIDAPAPKCFVPKLGIKSWTESRAHGLIQEGANMGAQIDHLLRAHSPAQALAARSWSRAGLPLMLYLMPYVDFSEVSEMRFLVNGETLHLISRCERGESAEQLDHVRANLRGMARSVGRAMGFGGWLVDLAVNPEGRIGLIEVNPALGKAELSALLYAPD